MFVCVCEYREESGKDEVVVCVFVYDCMFGVSVCVCRMLILDEVVSSCSVCSMSSMSSCSIPDTIVAGAVVLCRFGSSSDDVV